MTDPSMISSGLVRGAYASSRSLQGGESNAAKDAASGFAEMVQDAAQSAVEKVRSGEEVAAAGLRGEAGTQEVVEAVLAMQSTVEVAVSVRDRFVEAYQEVLRMPI
ncbi:flagellar hook-basal body complex protein FliE [Palleronia salina]|uniref:Flagellar hook-basal body complex protein FliE n=2 Tax=Palleronia TaxID=315422 RepID=A0A1M6CWK3_9RHOB|nr:MULTISPECIES: flagellar hook-basal body complex protein FliE [Palleronia]SEN25438.1 flagellar hook-basal body complex protein FliE [Palleronia pelagia]SHI65376.1 flagellar hook-basal body complex protein FliE [Palleronia salina]